MTPENIERAARIFDAARRNNCFVDEIPVELGLDNLEDAARVAERVVALSGERVVGFLVGATSPEMQRVRVTFRSCRDTSIAALTGCLRRKRNPHAAHGVQPCLGGRFIDQVFGTLGMAGVKLLLRVPRDGTPRPAAVSQSTRPGRSLGR